MRTLLVLALVLAAVAQDGGEWVTIYSGFTAQKFDNIDGWVFQNQYQGNVFSTCGNVNLVGGYKAFGKRATALKTVKVPAHYKLKVNVQLWKQLMPYKCEEQTLGTMNGYMWQARWHYAEGSQLCGASNSQWNEAFYNIEFLVPHNSQMANIIMTSTLDEEADNESWAFRDFKLSYLPCPSNCGVCHTGDTNTCYFWTQAAASWFRSSVGLEEWDFKGGKPEASTCSGVSILGGYGNFGAGAVLTKDISNLPPHYQMLVKFQFWKIDSWDNEEFRVTIDGVVAFKQAFQWNEGIQLCGKDTGGNQGNNWAEKVVNVDFMVAHNTPNTKLGMLSTLNEASDNESWGVRDFFLFVAQCHSSCAACSGPTKNDCTACGLTASLYNGVCQDQGQWYVVSREFDADDKFGQTNGWTFDKVMNNAPVFSQCGTVNLVGGYQKFGAGASAVKKFTTVGQVSLRLQVQLWKIDSWDGEELFIFANDQKIFSIRLGFNDPQQVNLCGSPNSDWKERIIQVDQQFVSNTPEVTIKISSTLDQDANDESWGFRNFVLLYLPKIDCVVFYSECHFEGEKFELCHDEASLSKAGVTWEPKSVTVPGGYSVEAYQGVNFQGDPVVYKTSQECIGDDDSAAASFMQVRTQPQWVEVNSLAVNLRRKRQ